MHRDKAPLISVVIPYYNRSNTLPRAVESVKNQTYHKLEIITVDDGSSDASFSFMERFRRDNPEIRVVNLQQANAGPSAARNAGIRASRGEYVAFLDSDDSWLPDKLTLQMDRIMKEPDLIMVGTNYQVLLENGQRRIAFPGQKDFLRASYRRMLFKVFFCTSSILVNRKVFDGSGIWFREGKNHAEDLLFFLQVTKQYSTGRLHEPLTCYYKEMYGQDGLTADLSAMLRNDIENCLILAREPDHTGKKLNPVLARLLIGWTYLKHAKRLVIARRQKTRAWVE